MRFIMCFSLSVTLVVLLLACSGTSTNDSQAIDTPNPLPTPTAKPVPTSTTIPTVTNTPVPPTPTLEAIATATLFPPTPVPNPAPTRSQASPKPTPRPSPSATPSPAPTATVILIPTPMPTFPPIHTPPNPCLTVSKEFRERCEQQVAADRLKESGESGNYYAESFDPDNIPQIATFNFTELDNFGRMSKIRSGVGHDYSFPTPEYDPDGKSCRSMKHYFIQKGVPLDNALYNSTPHTFDWTTTKYFAPANGVIERIDIGTSQYDSGATVSVQAAASPGWYFVFMHVTLLPDLVVGSSVEAGQQIATQATDEDWGEIAVEVRINSRESHLVSFLQVASDEVLQLYRDRNVTSASDVIVPREQRDASPLACGGDDAAVTSRWFEGSARYKPNLEFIIWQAESTDNWVFFDKD